MKWSQVQYGIVIEKVNGDFEFKDVVFGYNKDRTVLNKLSFNVKANETVGFVGKSGSGKTTIFNLLCKMYDIDDGEIILFDQATSALDNETQCKIATALNNLKSVYTILIIAHRFSTIVNCDKIYYISNGKVIDSGTHSELLKTCNEYKHLYESEIKYNK